MQAVVLSEAIDSEHRIPSSKASQAIHVNSRVNKQKTYLEYDAMA